MRGLTRSEVDRAHASALKLQGWTPVSGLALCDEIRRLHDVLAAALHALDMGHPSGAAVLLRAEHDPAWTEPFPEMAEGPSVSEGPSGESHDFEEWMGLLGVWANASSEGSGEAQDASMEE